MMCGELSIRNYSIEMKKVDILIQNIHTLQIFMYIFKESTLSVVFCILIFSVAHSISKPRYYSNPISPSNNPDPGAYYDPLHDRFYLAVTTDNNSMPDKLPIRSSAASGSLGIFEFLIRFNCSFSFVRFQIVNACLMKIWCIGQLLRMSSLEHINILGL
jgi:hypothetical protein